jgi:uncharacterized surface protein with fasciclin (FAS1) repeats
MHINGQRSIRALPTWLVLAGAALLGLIAAACGGDSAETSTPGAGSAGTQGAAAPFGSACSQIPSTGEGSAEMMMTQPVVTAAVSNPLLTTFAADVMEAQLTDTLNDAPALTVFAPSNAAFESAMAADPSGMDAMMGDPTGAFAQLLSYHVVEGQLSPDTLAGEHTTLQGQTLTVEGSGDHFTVNGMPMVVCGDLHTDNATIYVIDEVLHPPA